MLFEIMNKQEETNGSNSHSVVIRHNEDNTGLSSLNLLNEKDLAAAEVFLKKIIASSKGGITNVNDGLAVLMRAKDLQLPFSTCIEHIHVINGKTGVDVHIIKSLLSRAGVTWECTKDYAPQYQYTDGNTIYLETQLPDYCVKCRNADEAVKATTANAVGVYPVKWFIDLNNKVYNEFQITDKCTIAINKDHALKLAKEGKFPIIRIPAKPVDFVTEYAFTRYKMINGKERVIKATSHFSYTEAQVAGFFEKDTYKKYARIMISHRAFVLGARDIASDALFGVMESQELKLVESVDLAPTDYEIIEANS
jgi:hypothetical protein